MMKVKGSPPPKPSNWCIAVAWFRVRSQTLWSVNLAKAKKILTDPPLTQSSKPLASHYRWGRVYWSAWRSNVWIRPGGARFGFCITAPWIASYDLHDTWIATIRFDYVLRLQCGVKVIIQCTPEGENYCFQTHQKLKKEFVALLAKWRNTLVLSAKVMSESEPTNPREIEKWDFEKDWPINSTGRIDTPNESPEIVPIGGGISRKLFLGFTCPRPLGCSTVASWM